MTNPCYNCEKRVVGCHSSCIDYKSFREEKDRLKNKIRAEKATHNYAVERQVRIAEETAGRKMKDRRYKRK